MAAMTPLATLLEVNPIDQNGYAMGDIVRAIYDIQLAIRAICTAYDASDTVWVAGVSDVLDDALSNLHTPSGKLV